MVPLLCPQKGSSLPSPWHPFSGNNPAGASRTIPLHFQVATSRCPLPCVAGRDLNTPTSFLKTFNIVRRRQWDAGAAPAISILTDGGQRPGAPPSQCWVNTEALVTLPYPA